LIDWLVGMMGLLWTFTIVDIEQFLFGVKMVKKTAKSFKKYIFIFMDFLCNQYWLLAGCE
jgi:hypothetical protein